MIKIVVGMKKLPHLSQQEFTDHWFNVHGPLIRSHGEVLRIKRYVQYHLLDHPLGEKIRKMRNMAEGFDGIAEIWRESMDDFTAAAEDPVAQAATREIVEDEKRFIDVENSVFMLGEDRVIIGD